MHRIVQILAMLGCGVCAPAQAAEFISYSTSAALAVPLADAGVTSDWNGFYAGVFGATRLDSTGEHYGLGVDLGVSTTVSFVLAGAEVAVEGLGNTVNGATYVQGVGRAGVLLTDSALVYGAVGYGGALNGEGGGQPLLGGGVELGLTHDLSVRAQYLRGVPIMGSAGSHQLTLGAQFHF